MELCMGRNLYEGVQRGRTIARARTRWQTAPVRLYDVTASPNCRKVRIAARELGLPLELIGVDLAGAREPGYLDRNPTGKVPTLVDDDGFVLWESGAILLHLADKRPASGLLPADPHRRADVLRWMFFAANHVQPWMSVLGQERLFKPRAGSPPDAAAIALAERDLARFLPVIERRLAGADHLAGGYSLADIAVGCSFVDCERRGVSLDAHPHIAAWRQRLSARPAWQE